MCEGQGLAIGECLQKVLKGSAAGPASQICQWGDMVDPDCTKEHDDWMAKNGAAVIGINKPAVCCRAMTLQCLSCSMGSKKAACAAHPNLVGCVDPCKCK